MERNTLGSEGIRRERERLLKRREGSEERRDRRKDEHSQTKMREFVIKSEDEGGHLMDTKWLLKQSRKKVHAFNILCIGEELIRLSFDTWQYLLSGVFLLFHPSPLMSFYCRKSCHVIYCRVRGRFFFRAYLAVSIFFDLASFPALYVMLCDVRCSEYFYVPTFFFRQVISQSELP